MKSSRHWTNLRGGYWAKLSGSSGLQILVILVICDSHRLLCNLCIKNHFFWLSYWMCKSTGCTGNIKKKWSSHFLESVGATCYGKGEPKNYSLLAGSPQQPVHLLANVFRKHVCTCSLGPCGKQLCTCLPTWLNHYIGVMMKCSLKSVKGENKFPWLNWRLRAFR
jgi:hypothetical protein